jgi:hypothetical protein
VSITRRIGPLYDPAPVRWTSIDDLAGTIDGLVATHLRLAEVLGESSRVTTEVALAPVLAGDAAQHAWHAELWRARRPSILELQVAGPDSEVVAVLHALGAGESLRDRLAAAYGPVLDGLIERVERLLGSIDPGLDAPTARTGDLVLADLRAQRRRAAARRIDAL